MYTSCTWRTMLDQTIFAPKLCKALAAASCPCELVTTLIMLRVEGEVVPVLKYHSINTRGGVEVDLHHSWPRHQMEVSGQLHDPWGKIQRFPLNRGLGGSQFRFARCGVEKNYPCRKSNPGIPARRYIDWAIPTLTMAGLNSYDQDPNWCPRESVDVFCLIEYTYGSQPDDNKRQKYTHYC
jgi:hypothetical protein